MLLCRLRGWFLIGRLKSTGLERLYFIDLIGYLGDLLHDHTNRGRRLIVIRRLLEDCLLYSGRPLWYVEIKLF